MATIHKVGQGDLYHIHFLDQRTDPGFGQGGGTDPGYGQGHPRPDRPDNSLPGGRPERPDQGLPGGGIPSNELPGERPPQVAPGHTLVLIRGPQGKWVYATIAPGSPPPRPVPGPPPRPDQGLPNAPARPDQGLPPGAQPKA